MVLYKDNVVKNKKDRPNRNVKINLEELPERPLYIFRTDKDRVKFIKKVEQLVRGSMEYRKYIKFLKSNRGMDQCLIRPNMKNNNGKKYTIEIHHEPFTLFDIVDTILAKYDILELPRNPLMIAEEVVALHYDGKIGLIPLTKTQHERVGNGGIFVPLQFIYQDYVTFFDENERFIPEKLYDKLKLKIDLSMMCDKVQSNSEKIEFTYIEVDGFSFPEIPEEWSKLNDAITN